MDQRVTTEPPVVELGGLELTLPSKAGPVDILRGIDLVVPSGRSIAIVGPSGSGKTSLLTVIGGLERATRGVVQVAEHDFTSLTEDQLSDVRGRNIGIVFQSFHLIPTMTASENVALPLELTGRTDGSGKARELLSDVGLGDRLHHYPAQLSGGEQQRVALARALAPRPRLLLADEPTGNLDSKTSVEIMSLFDAIHAAGNTVILVTHEEDIAEHAHRVIRLRDGLIESDVRRTVEV